jgi:hypothetical protein
VLSSFRSALSTIRGIRMMGIRQKTGRLGNEVDVIYDRKLYSYLQKPRVSSKIKRQMRRRRRHDERIR